MIKKDKKKRVLQQKVGLPPGTLVFTGERYLDTPNVTLIQYSEEAFHMEQKKDKKPALQDGFKVTWFDVRGVHDLNLMEKIGERFNIHALTLEDIVDIRQRPKFEAFKEGVFVTLRSFQFDQEKLELQTEQVSIYFGEHFVLSFQEDDDDLFIKVRERLKNKSGRIRQRGSDYLAYALIDSIVDSYFPMLDKIEEVMTDLEENILMNNDPKIKSKIHELKLQTLHLRKSVGPLREAINQFAKSESALIKEETLVFVRDLYDHIIQVLDLVETYRDLVSGLNDLYISELSFKMNSVMKVLTIITTIFVPLSFLAGLYGMNFDHMPELHWKAGYFILLGVMLVVAVGLLIIFKRKNWL
ncbi:MAG: magnesium/cobalt transporter CorA [Bacteroidota bacterium]